MPGAPRRLPVVHRARRRAPSLHALPRSSKRSHGNEAELFGKQLAAGINFAAYDKIPVSRTLPTPAYEATVGREVPPLPTFGQLEAILPPFLHRNVQKMG